MYVELAGALYHIGITPHHKAIKVHNSGDQGIVIHLWDTEIENGIRLIDAGIVNYAS